MSMDISELSRSLSSMEARETFLADDYRSNVDSSRPFRSVKEAVAIFGERLLAGEIAMPLAPQVTKPPDSNVMSPGGETFDHLASDKPMREEEEEDQQQQQQQQEGEVDGDEEVLGNGLKKLEADLEEMKRELRILKERESETEIALAALNAELHRNMSRLARAEAVQAKVKAVATRSSSTLGAVHEYHPHDRIIDTNPNFFPTIAQILSTAEDRKKKKKNKNKRQGYYGGVLTGPMKEKPIVPLVGDLFSWMKKTSDSSFHNPLHSSPHLFK